MRNGPGRARRQKGAVIATVGLMLLFLLGFMAFAPDLGRLFVVKTELQAAMDSCALAAAQALDGQDTSIQRAIAAGTTAGNLNRLHLQSADRDGQGRIAADTNTDIEFRDAHYIPTTDPARATYAECRHAQPGIRRWLVQAMGVFMADTRAYPGPPSVNARAVATRGPLPQLAGAGNRHAAGPRSARGQRGCRVAGRGQRAGHPRRQGAGGHRGHAAPLDFTRIRAGAQRRHARNARLQHYQELR